MTFIVSSVLMVIAIIVWRGATSKVRQNTIAFRPVAKLSVLAAGVCGISVFLQCFTQVRAGKDGLPIILDTK